MAGRAPLTEDDTLTPEAYAVTTQNSADLKAQHDAWWSAFLRDDSATLWSLLIGTPIAAVFVVAMTLGAVIPAVLAGVVVGAAGVAKAVTSRREGKLYASYEAASRSHQESARASLLARLPEDPLNWPAWVLDPQYALLHPVAMGAAGKRVAPVLFDALTARAYQGGTVGEQINALQGAVTGDDGPAATARPQAITRVGLLKRHRKLSEEYGNYLLDPLRILEEPLLNDVTDPLTAEFVESYDRLEEFGTDADQGDEHYDQLIERAWKAWRAASAHAKRTGVSSFDEAQKKKVDTAHKLLALALDPGTSDAERVSARKQAEKLLVGVVDLPRQAVAVIEASGQRALPNMS